MVGALCGIERRPSGSRGIDVFLSTERADQTEENDDLGERVRYPGY